jgi:hypothetical protein
MTLQSGRSLKTKVWQYCKAQVPKTSHILLVLRQKSRVFEQLKYELQLRGPLSRVLQNASRQLFNNLPLRVLTMPATFCEQVQAVRGAKVVVGFSGADLANSFFMRYDAVLVELFTENFLNTSFITESTLTKHLVDTTTMNDFSSYMSR